MMSKSMPKCYKCMQTHITLLIPKGSYMITTDISTSIQSNILNVMSFTITSSAPTGLCCHKLPQSLTLLIPTSKTVCHAVSNSYTLCYKVNLTLHQINLVEFVLTYLACMPCHISGSVNSHLLINNTLNVVINGM